MKLNLKVRLKNPTFWVTVIPAVLTIIYAVLDLFGVVPSLTKETALKGIMAVFNILAMLGVIVDPTTHGIGDSDRAMTYTEPYREDDYNEH